MKINRNIIIDSWYLHRISPNPPTSSIFASLSVQPTYQIPRCSSHIIVLDGLSFVYVEHASRLGNLHLYPSSFITVSNQLLLVYLPFLDFKFYFLLFCFSVASRSLVTFVGPYKTFICTTFISCIKLMLEYTRCDASPVSLQVTSHIRWVFLGIACTLLIYIPQYSLRRCLQRELWLYAYLSCCFL